MNCTPLMKFQRAEMARRRSLNGRSLCRRSLCGRLCLLAAGGQYARGTRVPVVQHGALLLHANGTLRVDTSVDVPRFDPGPEAVAYAQAG